MVSSSLPASACSCHRATECSYVRCRAFGRRPIWRLRQQTCANDSRQGTSPYAACILDEASGSRGDEHAATSLRIATVAALALCLSLTHPSAAHALGSTSVSDKPVEIFQLAAGGDEDFWDNVGRYISYFFSVLLGTAYTAVKPISRLLRRPTTAVFVVAGLAGLVFFLRATVSAMLGVNDEPINILSNY